MDEEKKPEPNIIDVLKQKAAVENQLDSFINPNERTQNSNVNNTINSGDANLETRPLIKIAEMPIPAPSTQNRPIIRTYKSDVEETIQTGHISSVNIALAESRKKIGSEQKTNLEIKKKKIDKNILIISAILIIGGALTIIIPQFLVNLQFGPKKNAVETVPSKAIMTTDVEEKINIGDINTNNLSTTLKERVDQSSTQLGQIKNIYLTEGSGSNEKLITAARFLDLIGANVPPEIQRTLKDQYMFGMYNYAGNQRFLILKVGEYDITFSGMLSWETSLWQDFKELFELNYGNSQSTTTDTAGVSNNIKFQDVAFFNKNCRVIKDSSGNIIFLYSIIDDNTIAITTNTATLKEIINRVSKANVVTQ
jgi:hypothetical protein